MGRKSSRSLWTAKLAGEPAQGGAAPVRVTNRASGSESADGAAPAHAVIHAGAGTSVTGNAAGSDKQTAENSQRLTRKGSAAAVALQRKAQAAYGTRTPFHGVVLGLDPSLRGTGIAIVRFSPPEQPRLLFSTTVRNKPKLTPTECLGNIARAVAEAIETYRPLCVSLEQTVYVQNVRISLTLGSARGAAIAPAAMQGLEVFEYAPMRLKQAVVGNGKASKEQVAAMVKSLVQAGRDVLPSDEADAAAAAICHAFTVRLP